VALAGWLWARAHNSFWRMWGIGQITFRNHLLKETMMPSYTDIVADRALLAPIEPSKSQSLFDWLHARPWLANGLGLFAVLLLVLCSPVLALFSALINLFHLASPTNPACSRMVLCPLWKFPGY